MYTYNNKCKANRYKTSEVQDMIKFEVGKEYTHGWIGDSELETTWKVIKRKIYID